MIGVGLELHRLLARFGFKSTSKCNCDQRASLMNQEGPDWCEANLETIVGWLEEEAKNRRLPFVKVAGRILVRRAISNARKKLALWEKK